MNELIKITYSDDNTPSVSGRELHEFLAVKDRYTDWFKRMTEYGFTDGADFFGEIRESTGGRPATDHRLTIDMAKELCMIQRTERGKQARQYFLALERAWNTPEQVMARALKMADQQILGLRQANSELTVQNAIMQPKAEYFDDLVDRNLLTNFRDTAKELKVKQNDFVSFLLNRKYIYRGSGGKLLPYAQHADSGLFEVKEQVNEKTGWAGTQTLITPKGRDTFRRLYAGA